MAGTMAGNNHGVAPGCTIHVVKALTSTDSDVYTAIEWVVAKMTEVPPAPPPLSITAWPLVD